MKWGINKITKTSKVIKYLKSNFPSFLINIKYIKSKKIDANRYTNKYFERNPIAPNKPIKKQSDNFISFEE